MTTTMPQHADMNMRSAYLHVLADAATSVLAIVALFGGLLWGAAWLDPVMGLVGAALVSIWAAACCATRAGFCSTPKWTRPWLPRCAR